MKIENSLNPNCSEAVFRFYTLEPKEIRDILQAIANEINANTDFKPHKNQKIPLFKTAKDYDSNYQKPTDDWYKRKEVEELPIWRARDKGEITQEEAIKKAELIWAKYDKEKYPKGNLLKACAGLGDNEAVITIEKDKGAFVLNIGNNDIAENNTEWVETIKDMGIKVIEAEGGTRESKQLQDKYARDCCCGQTFGFQDTKLNQGEEI